MKAAKDLFRINDERIISYEKRPLLKLLADRSYHSPEVSESDEENPVTTIINVYDLSWRSDEVIYIYFFFIKFNKFRLIFAIISTKFNF